MPDVPQDPENAAGQAPPEPRASRMQRRERAALDSLRTLIRDCYCERFGIPPEHARPAEIDLHLRVTPGENWQLEFDPALVEQLAPQVEQAQAGWGAYQPGRAYCFRCESSACEHSAPGSPLQAFAGYSETGTPQWRDLAQVFVEAHDERVDQLFEKPPRILTLLTLGRDLQVRQLSSFGRSSKTYSVLSQVVAGYFLLDGTGAERAAADRRLAITFQAAEIRRKDGRMGLELNPLCCIPGGGSLEELYAADWNDWLLRAQRIAAKALASIEEAALAARARDDHQAIRRTLGQVPAVLRRLASSIDKGRRQSLRRTRHAQERRGTRRPVHKAMDDLRAARPEHLFHDLKTDTIVVCGEAGRSHVFTQDGRHVTSFIIKPDSIGFRVRTQRWRPLDEAMRSAFRAHVAH